MSTRVVAVLLLCLAATLPAEATWTRGGLYGADVRAMALDPDDPDRVYLGTSQGEIYRSDDGDSPTYSLLPFHRWNGEKTVIGACDENR